MADENRSIRLEEVDWEGVLPFLRLFRAFRMATYPPKMILALLLVLLVYWGGLVLDGMWGPEVYPGEVEQFANGDVASFDAWRAEQLKSIQDALYQQLHWLPSLRGHVERSEGSSERTKRKARSLVEEPDRFAQAIAAVNDHFGQEKKKLTKSVNDSTNAKELEREMRTLDEQNRSMLASIDELAPHGIFRTMLTVELNAFGRLVIASATLRFGAGELISADHHRDTVVGSLRELLVTIPHWLYRTHRGFFIVLVIWALVVWSLLGGAISRMDAVRGTRDDRATLTHAIRFAATRWIWYFLAPILPLLIVLMLGLVFAVSGFVFFNLPVLDVIGSFLFGGALFCGTLMALTLLGLAASGNLLYPAIGVEGTDAFDAISRVYNYVLGRPWRWLFYSIVSLVYGAICYLFVGLIVFLTLWLTHQFAGAWVVADTADGINRFDAIMPAPRLGELISYRPEWHTLGPSGKIAAAVVLAWRWLFIGLLPAFALSFYFSAHTWIYLLLRRAADETEFDDAFIETAENTDRQTTSSPAAESSSGNHVSESDEPAS